MKQIGIIGIGNMGFAILKGISKIFDKENIFICDSNEEKLKQAKTEFEILDDNSSSDQNLILNKVDIVILAVKPQSFYDFPENLKIDLKNKIIISIMAGVSIDRIRQNLKCEKIIRSMPNLCVQVLQGLFGWIASNEVLDSEKDCVKKIFKSMGEEIELFDENKIDEITALSGSGPAYFFYLCEILENKAKEFGFNDEEARKIANMTFVGSALTLEKQITLAPFIKVGQEKSPLDKGDLGDLPSAEQLRKAVTSKGGTTEAAINFLQENKFDKIFKEAICKASERSKELNK